MLAKLGMLAAGTALMTALAVAAPAAHADDETTTTTESTTTTTESDTTSTTDPADTTTTSVSPETSTSTTVPPTLPDFPAAIDDDDTVEVTDLSVPSRPGTTYQTRPLPPPPTTTTTTAPPPPDPTMLPFASGEGRRAVYSKSAQRVWAVDANGTVLKTHRVSGKLRWCDPRVGTYSVWSRSISTYAIQNPTIKWGYMVRFTKGCNGGNIGFHEIPSQYGRPVQSIAQLGQPLSGGCVRQAKSDAIWMWNWAQIGTKVVVLP